MNNEVFGEITQDKTDYLNGLLMVSMGGGGLDQHQINIGSKSRFA